MALSTDAPIYTVTCDTADCKTTPWTGSDLSAATGWVYKAPAWPLGSGQPIPVIACPTHA